MKILTFPFTDFLSNMGFLGVCFEVGGEGGAILCLKPVRIMLETWTLVRKYRPIALLILVMSAFLWKKSAFFAKIVPLLKAIVWEVR